MNKQILASEPVPPAVSPPLAPSALLDKQAVRSPVLGPTDELAQQKYALDQHAIVSKADRFGNITYVNDTFCAISGYPREALLGQNHRLLRSGVHDAAFFADLWGTIADGSVWHGEICNRHRSGALYWVRATIVPFLDAQGHITEYLSIRTDITETKRLEQEMQAAKEAAEQANRAKSDFLANMSHEIRTPLNAVLGLTALLGREDLSVAQHEIVGRIGTAGRILLRNLNDILDFSKIEAGQMGLESETFALGAWLADIQAIESDAAAEKGLTLHVHPLAQDWCVQGDRVRLAQVLLNLVSNAIKFTAQGGVEIRAETLHPHATGAVLRVEVRDTGIGIAPEQIGALFQPFIQADSSVTRRFGGTGLGLSICKSLMGLMGGGLGVESVPGQGSVFWFEWPFSGVVKGVAAVPVSLPKLQAQPAALPRLVGRQILVVDDNEMNRYTMQRALEREGAKVLVAVNGQAAVDAVVRCGAALDAVLMDVQMPVMGGLDATRWIRRQPGSGGAVPVLICSAGVQPEDRAQAREAGANGFMSKPIDWPHLIDELLALMPPVAATGAEPVSAPIAVGTAFSEPGIWSIEGLDGQGLWAQLDGDGVCARLMLGLLAQALAQALRELPQQLRDDRPAAARHLHKLRGSAGAVCAYGLVHTCAALEEAVTEGADTEAGLTQALLAELATLAARVGEALAGSTDALPTADLA